MNMLFERNDLSDPTDYNTLSDNYNQMFDQYCKLYSFVQFIANDYVELSHHKTAWQRDEYIKQARKILGELND
jgi:hypothetical protein